MIFNLQVKYRRISKSGKEMIAFDGYWELRGDAKYNNQPPMRAHSPSYTNEVYSNGTPVSWSKTVYLRVLYGMILPYFP